MDFGLHGISVHSVSNLHRAVDINLAACRCTKETLFVNNAFPCSDVLNMDLVGTIDVTIATSLYSNLLITRSPAFKKN